MELLERHFDTAFDAPDGIKKLRELILTLAMQGKLVSQDPNDLPASELLKEIEAEKKRLVKQGKIKEPKPLPPVSAEEVPYALPKSWEWVRLGESMLKITDGTHHSPPNGDRGDFLYISAKNIKDDGVMLSNATYVTQEVHEEIYSRCDPEHGNILYIKDGATTGIVTINGLKQPFSMLSSVALLKQPKGINNRYLLFALKAPFFYAAMRAGMTGVAITRVTLNKLQNAVFPLAPQNEQFRIVAKIDELMARCDALEKLRAERDAKRLAVHAAAVRQLLNVADTDGHVQAREFLGQHFGELYTVKENVTELRKAILQLAVMGKLVPQDSNEPSIVEVPLKDLAQKIGSGSTPTGGKESYVGSGIPLIRSMNVHFGGFKMDGLAFINESQARKLDNVIVQESDVLLNITGASIGRVTVAPPEMTNARVNQHVCIIRPNERLIPRYLEAYLASPLLQRTIDEQQVGATREALTKAMIERFLIPVRSLKAQHRIVAKIDQLMFMCDTLEEKIDTARETQSALLNAMMAQYAGQPCA